MFNYLLFLLVLHTFLFVIPHTSLCIFFILYLSITNIFILLYFKNLSLFFLPIYSFYLLFLTCHLYSIFNILLINLFYYLIFYNLSRNILTILLIHTPNIPLSFYYILFCLSHFVHFIPLKLNFNIFHLIYNSFFYLVKISLSYLLLQTLHFLQNNLYLDMANIICSHRSSFIIYIIFSLNIVFFHTHILLLYPNVPFSKVKSSLHYIHPT